MNMSSLSINRPVMATVISIVIVLFGYIGFRSLGLREYPSVDPPIVSVQTNYTGASADVIESQITEPLEESINGIAGIRSLSSTCSDGRSSIRVEFELGVDLEAAANDVREKVSQAQRLLPPDADPPVVSKSDANSNPIMSITVQSNRRNLMQLSEFATNVMKERIQTIPGVSNIRIWGEKRYAIRIKMDPTKLTAYSLTPLDVRTALQRQNLELPSGRIEGYRTELTIRTEGRLFTPEEFSNIVLRESGGATILLSDVATVDLEPQNKRSILRGNNMIPMVGVAITPLPGANYIDIADRVYDRVNEIKKDLPEDIILDYAFDGTVSIRNAIKEVEETLLLAFGLVVLVIFIFLRNWRTTLIPVIAIPISLIGAFFIMYVFNFSINILTLLGIVLATGLVVDDAIVVMENIFRRIEAGEKPYAAAHEGSKEIYFAIISTSITLIIVFLPIVFLQGLTGRLFREFGITVAGSILISMIVSLTLTPMMCARFLRQQKHGAIYNFTEKFFVGMTNFYNRTLKGFMRFRGVSWLITIMAGFGIYMLLKQIPSELAPMEDKSSLRIVMTSPEGTSYEIMDRYLLEVLKMVDTLPEKRALIAVTAPGFTGSGAVNSAFVNVILKQPEERTRTQDELAKFLMPKIGQLNYAKSLVTQEQTISTDRRGGGLPVQFVIQAPNFDDLKRVLPIFMEEAAKNPAFAVTDLDLKFNKPELRLEIDRERARKLNVSIRDIAETLQLYYAGQRYGYFIKDSKQYEVIGEADRIYRDDPRDLSSLYVRNTLGELIPMSNLVRLIEQSSPPQLFRFNRYLSATVSAGLNPGYTIGQGIEAMEAIKAKVLDESFQTELTGTSKDFKESSGGIMFAFLLALALVYLTLAAQFESFFDPLIIMVTVPLALVGALLSLWWFNHTLNIFSEIGIIVLVGIVTKNGILIVEFANQKMEEGMGAMEAAVEAATLRLRAILMTSIATMLGVLPIALALGAASTSRIPMGVAIIGGLSFSLVLTLYVIPAIYTFFNRQKAVKHEAIAVAE
ncbi:efflux RND transporter permease subunit [Haliscomenobacter sp.]|uniref:efflux RND transporter permease subunit n=1 Tax=Haliscomenobacter sp. TaxID=2717303 RepID=UPI003364F77C